MAYLILADKQGEFDRRELTGAVEIGRSPECDICIRDILLSRKHCRIEPFGDRWVVSDLGSKNGTRVGNETITRHVLMEGDVIRIGKLWISYKAGAFVAAPQGTNIKREARASDPHEALSGTVLGFQLFDMEEDSRVSGFPIPKPKPPEPVSMREDAVSSLVTKMASESWDAALAKKTPAVPKPSRKPAQPPTFSAPPVELQPAPAPESPAAPTAPAPAAVQVLAPPEPVTDIPRRVPALVAIIYVLMAVVIACVSIGLIIWKSNPGFVDWFNRQSANWLVR